MCIFENMQQKSKFHFSNIQRSSQSLETQISDLRIVLDKWMQIHFIFATRACLHAEGQMHLQTELGVWPKENKQQFSVPTSPCI